jgi:hypothetical protein
MTEAAWARVDKDAGAADTDAGKNGKNDMDENNKVTDNNAANREWYNNRFIDQHPDNFFVQVYVKIPQL